MTSPSRPAAYILGMLPGPGALARRRTITLAARQQGWPAPTIYADDDQPSGSDRGRALDRLEAAIIAGRHDGLVMTAPRDPVPLMQLLSHCTKHGVTVRFLPPAAPDDVPGPMPVAATGPGSSLPRADEPWNVLPRARLEALTALYPDWRIWLDQHGWHARRRKGYLQDYRPGAPAFSVHADTATGLAAQLCWQQAADIHAPYGCTARQAPHRTSP
jgi:hypothetical protein